PCMPETIAARPPSYGCEYTAACAHEALIRINSPGKKFAKLVMLRFGAGGIPRAEFVQLDIRNHILQEHEPAWRDFNGAVLRFTGQNLRADAGSGCDTLAPRERQILSILRWGWANARIAFELELSERTVRNHSSRLYENPGVHSRGETVTLAYEHGFGS
ncbi:MAG TPA: LuxR C-terminal-related transcriptional regulator, partial [Arenicellales bacterium]|nr:LuxR C-terminal-related transcriptional regulator [Arenicellales bacterium]